MEDARDWAVEVDDIAGMVAACIAGWLMMVLAPAMEEEEGDRRRVDHFRGRVLDMYEEKDEDMESDAGR